MAHLVEATRYKPEGRVFDSQLCHWNFLLTLSFRPQYGSGANSDFNRSKYQRYLLGSKCGQFVGLETLQSSCADFVEILRASFPCSAKGFS